MPRKSPFTCFLLTALLTLGCADTPAEPVKLAQRASREDQQTAGRVVTPVAADGGASVKAYEHWDEIGYIAGESGIKGLAFLPSSSHLVVGSFDGKLTVVDVRTCEAVNSIAAHDGSLTTFALSRDGSRLASGDAARNVKIWNTHTWECIKTLDAQGIPYSIGFAPDGSTLATSGERVVELWRVGEFGPPRRIELGIWPITGLVFSHSGDTLFVAGVDNIDDKASGGEGGTLRAYDVESLELLGTMSTTEQPSMWALALSTDDRQLAMVCGLCVHNYNWTRNSGRVEFQHRYTFSRPHKSNDRSFEAQFYSSAFDPSGEWLAFCAASPGPLFPAVGHVEVVHSANGSPFATLTPSREKRQNIEMGSQSLKCIAYSEAEAMLAAGGNEGRVTLWKQSPKLIAGSTVYQPPDKVDTYWKQNFPDLPIPAGESFAAKRFRLLYDTVRRNTRRCFAEAREAVDADEERALLKDLYPPTDHYVARLIDIALSDPGGAAGLDALIYGVYLLSNPGRPGYHLISERSRLFEILRKNHAHAHELSRVCYLLENPLLNENAEFLRFLLENSQSREVRAHACISLANFYTHRGDVTQAESLFERVIRDFAKIELRPQTFFRLSLPENPAIQGWSPRPLGEIAEGAKFAINNLEIGKTAPEIEGTDIDGAHFKLSDYRGKVVVLCFSGNWCGPCRAMYPQYRHMMERLDDKPFAVLHVNSDSSREEVRRRKLAGDVTWRSWWDRGSSRGPIATRWGIAAWPTIYLIDADGVIRHKNLRGESLDSAVDDLVSSVADPS